MYGMCDSSTQKLRSWPEFSTRIPWDSGKHGLHACTQNSATGKLLLYYPLPKRSYRSSLCVNIWRLRPAASAGKCPKEVSRPGGSKSEAPTAFSSLHFCLLRALDPMCVLKRPFARFPRIDRRSRDGGDLRGDEGDLASATFFCSFARTLFCGKIMCTLFSPVRYETPLTNPFRPGMSLWKTEWLMIMNSLGVSSQELWMTKSRFFMGEGQDTAVKREDHK